MQSSLNTLVSARILREVSLNDERSPVLFVDPSRALLQVDEFRRELPGVKLYYALKSFNDRELVRAIDSSIDGYDIASGGEYEDLRTADVAPNRMVFSNPVKIPQEIERTHQGGVSTFAYQSSDEIRKLAASAPGARVMLRIKVDHAHKTDGQSFARKFGAEPADALQLMTEAREAGLTPIGLTFHVGSQSTNPQLWADAIDVCAHIYADAAKQGLTLTMLDIGGGFPIEYGEGTFATFHRIAEVIREHLGRPVFDGVEIIAEPGRFICADAAMLRCTVIGMEERENKPWLYIDVGIFSGLMEAWEFGRLLQSVHTTNGAELVDYVLAGPTCDGDDVLPGGIALPRGIKCGDTLLIPQAGAYVAAYASDFNHIRKPALLYCRG